MAMARPSTSDSPAGTSFRLELVQRGVPEIYVDALLDPAYMERLIVATAKQNNKRQKNLNRYYRLNMVIFVFLIFQAILGVWVALYKTYLQPEKIISGAVRLDNIDMVLMVDTSNHMRVQKEKQLQAVQNFSGEITKAVKHHKAKVKEQNEQRLQSLSEEGQTALGRFLGRLFATNKPKGDLSPTFGGSLRLATATFNRESKHLHGFTQDLRAQAEAIENVNDSYYHSNAHMKRAMTTCMTMFGKDNQSDTQKYCVLIGDNEAMCDKPESPDVYEVCRRPGWEHLCPDDIDKVGTTVEYSQEIKACETFVTQSFADVQLIMMFTVGSDDEANMRLRMPMFRNFVFSTTNCTIQENVTEETVAGGKKRFVNRYKPEDTYCERFIMAVGLDELLEKSRSIANLLEAHPRDFKKPNEQKDFRYLGFLLLPLNLVFYWAWTHVVRWYASLKQRAQRVLGKTKKMIKVTKTLVEKPARRNSGVERLASILTEVELAEVASLRPHVKFKSPMTFRARLKGGWLRHNAMKGIADGHGASLEWSSNWTLEPVSGTAGEEPMAGEAVRIRNAKNELLCISEDGGTCFVSTEGAGTEFELLPIHSSEMQENRGCQLAEALRIRSRDTGKFLRVTKDGFCDAQGAMAEPETQFVVDQGGQALASGSIMTFRSLAAEAYFQGFPDGAAQVSTEMSHWSHWLVEKSGANSSSSSAYPGRPHQALETIDESAPQDSQSAVARSTTLGIPNDEVGAINTLKVGDVVTLRAYRQLEVDEETGLCHCGDPLARRKDKAEIHGSLSGIAAQEFVIERMGMGLVHLHDTALRRGHAVCLKPVPRPASDCDEPVTRTFLKVHEDGSVSTGGKASDLSSGFIVDAASLNNMVTPLGGALSQGDVELLISPLWNKSDEKRYDALSSSWTHDEELSKFRGAVVVANANGTYTVPKAHGESDKCWVAVVNDGVDVAKAARQAARQGATGLIIRCQQALSLDKLASSANDSEVPELPAVFVNRSAGEALTERGIVLKGCEFKRKHMTQVMRSLGRFAGAATASEGGIYLKDVHKAVGEAVMQIEKEKVEREEEKAKLMPVFKAVGQASNFKWQVNANTHYIWSGGGGGATSMKVNYGAKAPPSAHKEKLNKDGNTQVDASAAIAYSHTIEFGLGEDGIRTTVGVGMVDSDDFKQNILGQQLEEVLLDDDGDVYTRYTRDREQLCDDSDFKIEYHFKEVEVPRAPAGQESALDSDEEMMEELHGTGIQSMGVPRKFFWLVAFGLLVSTTALVVLLFSVLNAEMKAPDFHLMEDGETSRPTQLNFLAMPLAS
eukprot:TRINITY_DN56883_c0_g1_i1.p1 TRINITY_DN56883_c0_g1~~TRINITY_DN56883_c0_g1_i1.p1  ORF type:complete len:1305 (-),score=246.48 TRINITY_DN56883_c0_g1_i1:164-4078(-)